MIRLSTHNYEPEMTLHQSVYLFQQSVMTILGGLALSLSVSQTQFESLQLPLQAAPPQLHPGGPGFSCLQRLPQTPPLCLQTHLSSSLLVQQFLSRRRERFVYF